MGWQGNKPSSTAKAALGTNEGPKTFTSIFAKHSREHNALFAEYEIPKKNLFLFLKGNDSYDFKPRNKKKTTEKHGQEFILSLIFPKILSFIWSELSAEKKSLLQPPFTGQVDSWKRTRHASQE